MNSDFLPHRGQGQNTHHIQPSASPSPTNSNSGPQFHEGGGFSSHHKPPKKSLKEWLRHLTKKQWAILITVAVLVLGGIGFGVYSIWLKDDTKPVTKKQTTKKETPKPTPEPLTSTLTGLPIADASINDRPVTGIMIENSRDARPQSGLTDAGVVFEAIAEGGITRFLTLWQDTDSDYIGPVRSVRPYYVQWLMGFDGAIAHAGGSGDALAMIKNLNVKDLDQFHNSGAYWRVSSRYAPHNLYTSTAKLHELEAKKGFGKANYTGFARKKEAPTAAPTARTIDFNISGALYNSHYDYDAATNSYLRSVGGAPHKDERSGAQIAAKAVVGLVMPQGKNGIYTTYNTLGSGRAYIFQDGVVAVGNWYKDSNTSQFTFKDDGGAELKLNPGKTWLTIVGGTDRITYNP
ncbi:MAG TPA: DUF3048 domain-containing protein [Candidatus Saccharimonadales bacterium]|nr:DUF3048 domain-containing protein [Candidatus Saccharimonadales bacterium]